MQVQSAMTMNPIWPVKVNPVMSYKIVNEAPVSAMGGVKSTIVASWPVWVSAQIFLSLVAAGLAGNHFSWPIFLNINFLFGSIFSMLTLQLFGLRLGVLASILIASYTYIFWSHPYAIIILSLEVAIVGWMMRFRNVGLVLADAVYWLVVGIPLVYFFYRVMLDVPLIDTNIVMIKQAVNGIANAILARLLFTGLVLLTRNGQITYRDLIYNLLTVFALYPVMILLILAAHHDLDEADQNARNDLFNSSLLMTNRIFISSQTMRTSVDKFTGVDARLYPSQIPAPLEKTYAPNQSFPDFSWLERESESLAICPEVGEQNRFDLGRNVAGLPLTALMTQNLKPLFSGPVIGQMVAQTSQDTEKAQEPKPPVSVPAHLLNTNESVQHVKAAMGMDQIREMLDKSTQAGTMHYTLLDIHGNVILTNRTDQTITKPFVRPAGQLTQLDSAMSLSQWVPSLAPNTPRFVRWKASSYVIDSPIGNSDEWRLTLEQPIEPFLQLLYKKYTVQLMLLFALLITALTLAEWMSRKFSARIEELSEFTRYLPNELATGIQPVWPISSLAEHRYLISNFKEMASALSKQFRANRELTASLEQRVLQRTQELEASERKYHQLIDNSHDIIYTLNTQGEFSFVSQAWTTLLGHSVEETLGRPFTQFVHPDDAPTIMGALQNLFATGQEQINITYRVRDIESIWHWHTSNASPIKNRSGVVTAFEGIAKDISLQKTLEEEVRTMAFYDPLTQLPNRRLLDDRLNQILISSRRTSYYGALVFLDLDKFKELNDEHGHDVGDLLLIEVGKRLARCVRKMDTVARYGGDEFVILLSELSKVKADSILLAQTIAEKIRLSLAEPYHLATQPNETGDDFINYQCTASIGVVVFLSDTMGRSNILKLADAAMYQAKATGRNAVRFCEISPELEECETPQCLTSLPVQSS